MQNIEKLLNLKHIQINGIDIADNKVIILCSSIFNEAICPKCNKKTSRVPKYYTRIITDMEIFGRKTTLKLTERQFKCESCHKYFNENFIFVKPKKHMTERYREYIYKNCKHRDIKYVAEQENLSWDTVNNIYNDFVKKKQ